MSLNLILCGENEVLRAKDEWLDNQKHPSGTFRKMLGEQIDKDNPRHKEFAVDAKRCGSR